MPDKSYNSSIPRDAGYGDGPRSGGERGMLGPAKRYVRTGQLHKDSPHYVLFFTLYKYL